MNKKLLWLDDTRDPVYNEVKFDGVIHWVKSVKEFEAYLEEFGLPDKISFDYILGNMPDMFTDGIGAAKAVIRYCTKNGLDNPLPFPVFSVHSEHDEAYKLNDYIIRNIELYDLGEVRQEGEVKTKKKDDLLMVTGPSQGKAQDVVFHKTRSIGPTVAGYGHHAPVKKSNTPGRNEPCNCGSGKKYKRCCGK